MSGTPFDGVDKCSIAFADVDGDNDNDVLITGLTKISRISKLYTNDGSGTFTEMSGTPFDGVAFSSIAFADVDGDNDNDLLITGQIGSAGIAKLFTNDGDGTFVEMTDTPFDGVLFSYIAFADVDGDNDNDLLITGLKRTNTSETQISKLYTNDGGGEFTYPYAIPNPICAIPSHCKIRYLAFSIEQGRHMS
ncbi:MAG: VCBS repeat-containing protein [Saprospiraceae bacterium]|nr:VCBS repeat-containing protein [Saprospiraceae bacterium]